MTFAINVLGWIGAAALLSAYWLVSTQKVTGNSRTYQAMNLLGASWSWRTRCTTARTHRLV